mmetsp:Transcript_68519/g.190538  ORF Transcript_68519/g.190538 Transcript_68519/m.190538 type:complete len:282 (-) Transcript_68519:4-849(-)
MCVHLRLCLDLYLTCRLVRTLTSCHTGSDLFERIVTRYAKGYPEDLARTLMAQILAAVRYLHERDILHRDLKPENIMLATKESDTDIKLADFGLAKAQAQCKTFCGTPQYYAPEVLKRQETTLHQGRYGPAADMWSVGVILYVVLSGSPAFRGESLDQQIHTGRYKPMTGERWADVSECAKDLVKKLLTVSETERLTVTQAQAHDWFAMGGKVTSAPDAVADRTVGIDTMAEAAWLAAKQALVETDGDLGAAVEWLRMQPPELNVRMEVAQRPVVRSARSV